MIYTQPQGTVYKFVHSNSGTVNIAVKADNNCMRLRGFHSDIESYNDVPVLLQNGWNVVQNVYQLTEEEKEKLAKALSKYEKVLGKWTPPKGFGANFVEGCLIVWPKNMTATEINMRQYVPVRLEDTFVKDFFNIPVREYIKDTTKQTQGANGKSDGSSADYYKLPEGCTQLQDLISERDMNAQMGEIFRAAYRYGLASHSDQLRDAKKIKFYIDAEIKRLENVK